MSRRVSRATTAVAASLLMMLGGGRIAGASPIPLVLSQATAFSVLGHSCGGIQEQSFATGFDPSTGYPTGDVHLQTRCGGSGRGGGYHTTTYAAWVAATWDLTGTLIAHSVLASAPTVDSGFTAFDAAGNEVYDQSNLAYLLLASGFVPAPRITDMSPTVGPVAGGTSVAITGTGFTADTSVSFGDAPAASVIVAADTSISAVSPASAAGTVDVTVTTPGGSSVAGQFTFVAAPVVSELDPTSGPVDGGTLVTITGTGFIDVTAVYFGETPTGFTVNDESSITALAPAGEAADTVRVQVVTVGGASATSAATEFSYTTDTATSTCGDGVVDPGEECDDGPANGADGDCCSATCAFQPFGTPCADDGSLCSSDRCDGAGSCAHEAAPSSACTPPDVASGASLLMRRLPSGRNQTEFQWAKGPIVPLADFGDPTGGERYALCIYDQNGPNPLALAASPSVGVGAVWKGSRSAWKFHSTTGTPDGITSVALAGAAVPLKAKVAVKALNAPSFGTLPLAPGVVVQLKTSSGACWGASFSTPAVNTASEFKAKSD